MDLKPEEIIAIGNVFKDKAIGEAKAKLPEGAVCPVNFKVHVQGTVTKGHGTPEVTTTIEPKVALESFNVFCFLLKELGIGAERLKRALDQVPNPAKLETDSEFFDLFSDAAASLRKKLPKERITSNGKSGSVTMVGSATKVAK
jgi:hypothetical protein